MVLHLRVKLDSRYVLYYIIYPWTLWVSFFQRPGINAPLCPPAKGSGPWSGIQKKKHAVGFSVLGLGLRVQGSGFRVQGLGCD